MPASHILRWGISRSENSVRGTVFVIVKGGSEIRFAGLAAVRITWITAIVVCLLAILIGLLSGTDSRNSSGQLPGFAFSDGGDPVQQSPESASLDPIAALGGVVDGKAQRTMAGVAQGDRSQRADERAPGDTHSGTRVPGGSGSQPGNEGGQRGNEGGRGPSPTPRAKSPQPPSSNPSKPTPAPPVSTPKLPQAPVSPPKPAPQPSAPQPSVSASPSPPSVSVSAPAPVQVPGVKVPDVNVTVGLP